MNGAEMTALGKEIDPDSDRVLLDGKPVHPRSGFVYILLNKPPGYLVSLDDPHHTSTVFDLLGGVDRRVFPVGRLDLDTSGVLLFTDDGELTFRLCHPSFGVEKTYLARVEGIPDSETIRALSEGIELGGRTTATARVHIGDVDSEGALLSLTLHEGRKRQIKRMCKSVGHPVRSLERTDFGSLTAKGLEPGEWRYLSLREIKSLKQLVELIEP